jgi:hypothetical protein
MNEQQHAMILEKTDSTGVEEWYCPTCGRRMLINWKPKFKRTVLEAGDPDASHGGFKGGQQIQDLMISSMNELSSSEEAEVHIDEARLAPWQAWLEESGFEDLWNSDVQ